MHIFQTAACAIDRGVNPYRDYATSVRRGRDSFVHCVLDYQVVPLRTKVGRPAFPANAIVPIQKFWPIFASYISASPLLYDVRTATRDRAVRIVVAHHW